MQKSLVSVIVPVYNAAQYLPQCLESLLCQTYEPIEIILIDDGSKDASLEICRKYAQQDSRVLILSQTNKGVSAARNKGIMLAKGGWITFVDADDWVEPNHLEELVDCIEDGAYDCAVSGYWLEYSQKSVKRSFAELGALVPDRAIKTMFSPYLFQGFLWNKLFRSSIIRKYRVYLSEDIFYLEDMLFCVAFFSKCRTICCNSAVSYHYRQHAGSAVWQKQFSNNQLAKRLTAVSALQQIKDFCKTKQLKKLCAARLYVEYSIVLRTLLLHNTIGAKEQELIKIIRNNASAVLFSLVDVKTKIKYVTTVMFPKWAARYWNSREIRSINEEGCIK